MDRFTTFRPRISLLSLIAVGLLAAIAITSIALSTMLSHAAQERGAEQFEWNTRQVTSQVQNGLNNNNTALYMARSFVLNTPNPTATQWSGFFRNQDVFSQFSGINSISYIQLVPDSELANFTAAKRKDVNFGPNYTMNPAGTRDVYGLGVLTVSKNNVPLGGFDVYSTPERRLTYQSALATGQPTTSPQITLNTGATGIFMALPVVLAGDHSTFVNVAIHTKDFFDSVITPTTLGTMALSVSDVTNRDKPTALYSSLTWNNAQYDLTKSDQINVGGRTWQLNYRSQLPYVQRMAARYLPYMVLFSGLTLSVSVLLALYIMFRTVPKTRRSPRE